MTVFGYLHDFNTPYFSVFSLDLVLTANKNNKLINIQ